MVSSSSDDALVAAGGAAATATAARFSYADAAKRLSAANSRQVRSGLESSLELENIGLICRNNLNAHRCFTVNIGEDGRGEINSIDVSCIENKK